MSEPRDLSLERLNDRDGLRSAHFGRVVHVASPVAGFSGTWTQAAYEALIDAVFTAPGASEWLSGLRRAVTAMLADKDAVPRDAAAREAPNSAGLRLWRP